MATKTLNPLYEAAMRALEAPIAKTTPNTRLAEIDGEWLTVERVTEKPGRKGRTLFCLVTDHGDITGIPQKYERVLNQPDVVAYINSTDRAPVLVAFTYHKANDEGKRGHWSMDFDLKEPE